MRLKLNELKIWHSRLFDAPWLAIPKLNLFIAFTLILAVTIAAGMNWFVRADQYKTWENNPQLFYLDDGTPLFTTTDAPHYLSIARTLKEGLAHKSYSQRRVFHENQKSIDEEVDDRQGLAKEIEEWSKAPLLSGMIALLSDDSSSKALLVAGNRLVPLTAILSTVMVAFAFGAAGYWAAGSIAAAGSGLSFAFLSRTSAGRIDTDQLNMGFFYLLIGLVIVASKVRSKIAIFSVTSLCAFTFWIFDWWYSKPIFGWIFLVSLLWLSFVFHKSWRRSMAQTTLFFFMSGLFLQGIGVGLENPYLVNQLNIEGYVLPNTLNTITETSSISFTEILNRVSGSFGLGLISLAGFAIWSLKHPALAVVFGLAAAFALLNFVIGNRAIFYSAPVFWFGFGWIILSGFQFIRFKFAKRVSNELTVLFGLVVAFFVCWFSGPTNYVQGPTFDRNIVNNFRLLNAFNSEKGGVIATWWDYGYTSMFFNDMNTLHDGGKHNTASTFLLAHLLLEPSQQRAARILGDLVAHGSGQTMPNHFPISSEDRTGRQVNPRSDVFLVLTSQMASWMPSISQLGMWDPIKGMRTNLGNLEWLQYQNLSCNAASTTQYRCDGDLIDINSGSFKLGLFLDGLVQTQDGIFKAGKKFEKSNTELVLQIDQNQMRLSAKALNKRLYFSLFNQLFYLNAYDQKYFKIVFDAYPHFRVFKLNSSK